MKSYPRRYARSVMPILLITAAAKLYSATGAAKVLDIPDALLPVSIRQALWLVGLIEAAIAGYLILGRTEKIKLVCVAWLGGNFILYRLAAALLAVGSVTEKLPLPPATIDQLLWLVALYLFCGSMFFLLARKQDPGSCTVVRTKIPVEIA